MPRDSEFLGSEFYFKLRSYSNLHMISNWEWFPKRELLWQVDCDFDPSNAEVPLALRAVARPILERRTGLGL
jgi:hypothetical protein